MVTSEITLDIAKQYLRIDGNDDDVLITAIISAAKAQAKSFTGLTTEEMDSYEDIPIAVLSLIADMYDVRQATLNGTQLNPTVYQILGSHSKNLI